MPPKIPKGKRMPVKIAVSRGKKKKTPPTSSSEDEGPTPPPSEPVECSRSKSPSPGRSQNHEDDQVPGATQSHKKRPKVGPLVLTPEQEVDFAEWLKSFDFLYVKGRERYKDSNMKRRVWEDQAKKMGLDRAALQTWYESVRSKVGKLTDTRSGSARKEMSDRDKKLMDMFGFLKDHIVRQPSRVGSSLKAKLAALQPHVTAAATATATVIANDSDVETDVPSLQPQSQQVARPQAKPKGKSKSRNEGEDQFMEIFREQQEQSTKLQGTISGLLDPVKMSAQASWGSWIGTMAESFHPSQLPQFYMDTFNLVMRYQSESRQLALQQPQQPQQPQFVPQLHHSAFVPPQQPATYVPGDGQTYMPPPPLSLHQQQVQRRPPSSDINWDTAGPVNGRPSSTPATLTLSGLSDMSFSGLMGTSQNMEDLDTPTTSAT